MPIPNNLQYTFPLDTSDPDINNTSMALPNFFGKKLECHLKGLNKVYSNVYSCEAGSVIYKATDREFRGQGVGFESHRGGSFSNFPISALGPVLYGYEIVWDWSTKKLQGKAIFNNNQRGVIVWKGGNSFEIWNKYITQKVDVTLSFVGGETAVDVNSSGDGVLYVVGSETGGYRCVASETNIEVSDYYGRGFVAAAPDRVLRVSDIGIVKLDDGYHAFYDNKPTKEILVGRKPSGGGGVNLFLKIGTNSDAFSEDYISFLRQWGGLMAPSTSVVVNTKTLDSVDLNYYRQLADAALGATFAFSTILAVSPAIGIPLVVGSLTLAVSYLTIAMAQDVGLTNNDGMATPVVMFIPIQGLSPIGRITFDYAAKRITTVDGAQAIVEQIRQGPDKFAQIYYHDIAFDSVSGTIDKFSQAFSSPTEQSIEQQLSALAQARSERISFENANFVNNVVLVHDTNFNSVYEAYNEVVNGLFFTANNEQDDTQITALHSNG